MSNDILEKYEQLVETYGEGNCVLYDNGVVEVKLRKNGGSAGVVSSSIYIPLKSNTSNMITYMPGTGGWEHDAKNLVNNVTKGNGEFDYVLSVSHEWYDKKDYNTLEFGYDVAKNAGYNVDNVELTTFSGSGYIGFDRLGKFIKENPDVNTSMLVLDGYAPNILDKVSEENMNILRETNVPIVMLGPSGEEKGDFSCATTKLAQDGLNIYKMTSDRTDHNIINADAIVNGMPELLLGVSDDLNYGKDGNTISECNYKTYRYDPTNPNANERGNVQISVDDLKFGNGNEDIDTGTVTTDVSNDVSVTNDNVTTNNSADNVTSTDSIISSDLRLVTEAMLAINSSISSNLAFENKAIMVDSTSSIPLKLYDTQSSVLNISVGVCGNLSKETELIINMAKTIDDMDKDLANQANSLNSSKIDVELSKVIDSNITSGLSIRECLFSPGMYTEGTVGKICASDIDKIYGGGKLTGVLKENIDSEINDARNTKEQINSFKSIIGGSSSLQGEMWNKVSQKLDVYSDLMDTRIESMEILETAYEKSLKLVKDYMGDEYTELDESLLPEARNALEQLKREIDSNRMIVSSTRLENKTKEDGTTYTVTVYTYSAEERAAALEYIAFAEEKCTELIKFIEKLEGLADIMSQAEQIVNDALCKIYGSYGKQASDVVTGKSASYIPPLNTSYTSPRVSEEAFNGNSSLINDYGTYENYKNYSKISKYSSMVVADSYKLSKSEFDNNSELISKYGTYEDYIYGVEKENNPLYNKSLVDNEGINSNTDNFKSKYSGLDSERYVNNDSDGSKNVSEPSNNVEVSSADLGNTNETVNENNSVSYVESVNQETVSQSNLDDNIISENSYFDDSYKEENIKIEPIIEEEQLSSIDSSSLENSFKETETNNDNNNNILKTIGTVGAVGVAAGATLYGAKKLKDKKEEEDD